MTSTGLLVFAAWRWRQLEKPGMGSHSNSMFAAALATTLLVAPHAYSYDLSLLLLVMLLMFNSERWAEDRPWRRWVIAAAAILYAPLYPVLFAEGWSCLLILPMLVFALSGPGQQPARNPVY